MLALFRFPLPLYFTPCKIKNTANGSAQGVVNQIRYLKRSQPEKQLGKFYTQGE